MVFDFKPYMDSNQAAPDIMLIYPGLELYVKLYNYFSSCVIIGERGDGEALFSVSFTSTDRKRKAIQLMKALDVALQYAPEKDPGMFL